MNPHHSFEYSRCPARHLRPLLAASLCWLALASPGRGKPALATHLHAGEAERPADRRPRAGEPDEPGYQRYQSFRYAWLEVQGLADPAVAGTLNARLRALAGPPEFPPASPVVHGVAEPPDDTTEVSHAQIAGTTLTIVVEHGSRAADAAQRSLTSSVHHFDLATGRELTFADLFAREHWPALEKELRRAFDDFNASYACYSADEFPAITDATQGYFDAGIFHLLVRLDRSSAAVQDMPFLEVPAGLLTRWLSPRGRSILAAPITAGWSIQETGGEFFAISAEYPGLRLPLPCDGWVLWLCRWERPRENPQLALLHYFAGVAGTSAQYATTRAAIVRLADGRVLGHPASRLDPVDGAAPVAQPEWTWHEGRLMVRNPDTAETEVY